MEVTAKTVTLPEADWLVIDQALQRMPYGEVVGVYGRINEQFVAQQQQPVEPEGADDGVPLDIP